MTVRRKFLQEFNIVQQQFKQHVIKHNRQNHDKGEIISDDVVGVVIEMTRKQITEMSMHKLINTAVVSLMDINMARVSKEMEVKTNDNN